MVATEKRVGVASSTPPPPVLTPNHEVPMPDQVTLEQIQQLEALPAEFKKGWKTSEFWQAQIGNLIPLGAFGAAIFGVQVDTELLIASLGGLVPNLQYIFGRTWLKRKRIEGMTGK